jgi:hypothetical protein
MYTRYCISIGVDDRGDIGFAVIGLDILRRFLDGGHSEAAKEVAHLASQPTKKPASSLAKRVIACLDVRSNDAGDLVVTKGDQYDVREQTSDREVQTHTLIVSCRNFRRCVCY